MDHELQRGVRVLRRGFTLIETVVVTATVSLLVAMLLPALAGARASAQRLACASNARQLATANAVYAGDHASRLAPGAPGFVRNLTRWHGARRSWTEPFTAEGGTLSGYLDSPASSRAVRSCPAFAPVVRELEGRAPLQTGAFESSAGGYGYNNAYLGQHRGRTGVLISDRVGAMLHSALRPAETAAFIDAAFVSDRSPTAVIEYSFAEPRFVVGPGRPARLEPSVHFRHAGLAVTAWLDTHVSAEPMTFTRTGGVYRTDPTLHGLGWFGEADGNDLFDLE